MRKLIVLTLALCLLLTGCSWLDGEYHSVTPHAAYDMVQSQDSVVITS